MSEEPVQHLHTIHSVEDLKEYPSLPEGKNYRILNPLLNILLAVYDKSGIYIASRHCAWAVIVLNDNKLEAQYYHYPSGKIKRLSEVYASDELTSVTKELIQQLKPLKKAILKKLSKRKYRRKRK